LKVDLQGIGDGDIDAPLYANTFVPTSRNSLHRSRMTPQLWPWDWRRVLLAVDCCWLFFTSKGPETLPLQSGPSS